MTSFKVQNNSKVTMDIIHEPEGFVFQLPVNKEIIIETDSCKETIQLNVSMENEKITLSILDENSLYSVLDKNGNVFAKYF